MSQIDLRDLFKQKNDDAPVTRGELRAATKLIIEYNHALTMYVTVAVATSVNGKSKEENDLDRKEAQAEVKRFAEQLEWAFQLDEVSLDDD